MIYYIRPYCYDYYSVHLDAFAPLYDGYYIEYFKEPPRWIVYSAESNDCDIIYE
jgi:hypothetical protein